MSKIPFLLARLVTRMFVKVTHRLNGYRLNGKCAKNSLLEPGGKWSVQRTVHGKRERIEQLNLVKQVEPWSLWVNRYWQHAVPSTTNWALKRRRGIGSRPNTKTQLLLFFLSVITSQVRLAVPRWRHKPIDLNGGGIRQAEAGLIGQGCDLITALVENVAKDERETKAIGLFFPQQTTRLHTTITSASMLIGRHFRMLPPSRIPGYKATEDVQRISHCFRNRYPTKTITPQKW